MSDEYVMTFFSQLCLSMLSNICSAWSNCPAFP